MSHNLPEAIAHARRELAKYFVELRLDSQLDKSEVATRSGIEVAQIVALEDGTSEYALITVLSVATVYNIKVSDLYLCVD